MERIKTFLLVVFLSLVVSVAGFAFISVNVYHRSIGASLTELRLQSKTSTRVFETAQNAQKYMERRAKSEDKWYELPDDVAFGSAVIVFTMKTSNCWHSCRKRKRITLSYICTVGHM